MEDCSRGEGNESEEGDGEELLLLDQAGEAVRGSRNAYDEEGPWDVVVLLTEMVYEEDEDDGDNERGDPLADSDKVEGQRGILGGLLGQPSASSCDLEHCEQQSKANDYDLRW